MSILYAHRVKKYEKIVKKTSKKIKKCYKTTFLLSFRGRKGLIRHRIKRSTRLEPQKNKIVEGKIQKLRFGCFLTDFEMKN